MYSLAILLWQLDTREVPFTGHHPQAVMYQVSCDWLRLCLSVIGPALGGGPGSEAAPAPGGQGLCQHTRLHQPLQVLLALRPRGEAKLSGQLSTQAKINSSCHDFMMIRSFNSYFIHTWLQEIVMSVRKIFNGREHESKCSSRNASSVMRQSKTKKSLRV